MHMFLHLYGIIEFKFIKDLYFIDLKVSNYTVVVQTLEKAMAPHASTLAWKIPWMEEPGGLQSTGSQRVGHD